VSIFKHSVMNQSASIKFFYYFLLACECETHQQNIYCPLEFVSGEGTPLLLVGLQYFCLLFGVILYDYVLLHTVVTLLHKLSLNKPRKF
jgi:hypothetical protein